MSSFVETMKKLNRSGYQEREKYESKDPLFVVLSANAWVEQARSRPIPKQLFSEFWYEGELCILFADTNQGKSILAVQIGDSISRGVSVPGFKLQAQKQKILYCDFELSDKQFEARYSTDFQSHYSFDDMFLRAEINTEGNGGNIEERISQELENIVVNSQAKVLIIDNVTYLRSDTEKAKDALPLMKQLKAIKKKYGLSILCLAHTPKRDSSKPITRNDLQGSKMLINFCDSSFAIGESQRDNAVRYLKQIKARNTEVLYGSDNVILCAITKRNSFLGFDFIAYGDEREHLKIYGENDKESRIREAVELKQRGNSNVEIAAHFGVSEGSIRKWLKKAAPHEAIVPFVPVVPGTSGTSGTSYSVPDDPVCPF
jgi:hypothetical protein